MQKNGLNYHWEKAKQRGSRSYQFYEPQHLCDVLIYESSYCIDKNTTALITLRNELVTHCCREESIRNTNTHFLPFSLPWMPHRNSGDHLFAFCFIINGLLLRLKSTVCALSISIKEKKKNHKQTLWVLFLGVPHVKCCGTTVWL